MSQYNPEQPLLDLLPDVKAAVEEEAAAEAEYQAVQEEIKAKFGDRLDTARQRRDIARQTKETVKGLFIESAMSVWAMTKAADGVRRFFTVDNLITVEEKKQVVQYDSAAVRAWVFENMPALLQVNFAALEELTEKCPGLPTPLTLEKVNRVKVNIDRVAALTDVQPDALVREKTDGVSTPLMVRRDDVPPMSDPSVPPAGWED